MDKKKLKVTVVNARNIPSGRGNIYCEVLVLDTKGERLGKPKCTKYVKQSDPQWNELVEFNVDAKTFTGLMVRMWEKHTFRRDGFMGQSTIKFNTELLEGEDAIDDWFNLATGSSSKKSEDLGALRLKIQYGELKKDNKGKKSKEGSTSGSSDGGSGTGEKKTNPLSVSQNYHKKDPRLEKKTHIQIDEDDTPEVGDDDELDYDSCRKGAAFMEKITKDCKINLSNKNLELTHSNASYSNENARGVVGVNKGKWYFEVKLLNYSQMQVGWCTTNYGKGTNDGDCWTYDIMNAQIYRKGSNPQSYGERCTYTDTIGCSFDVEGKTICFYRNGKNLGDAFTDANVFSERGHPYVDLGRGGKAKVNFGKEPLSYPQDRNGFHPLHCPLSESELKELARLFNSYKAKGVDLATSASEHEDVIQGNGMQALQEDLGAVDDDDPLMMLVAWKLNCQTTWEISRQEWMDGFSLHGCHNMRQITEKTTQWRNEIKNAEEFKSFYYFVFNYLRGEKKVLEMDSVELVWDMLIKPRGWGLYDKWMQFLKESETKAISKDSWQQLFEFMNTYPRNLNNYDENAAWPLLFDEFVEWSKKESD
jgi:hypothetical protein